ncbi:MAG: UDP-N-acetylmuramoyl-L-alanine--D-glutamate ligase [Spirochaetales bacterium]|nr:UDP-N-acetylmuramoyl-L-alanine--D-glutamate ligase [Spirochaetales bacterium]
MSSRNFKNRKITVMGLGLNGGGLASVRFLAEQGARVTATDLRTAEILAPTIESLKDLDIRYVLGEHRMEDFSTADLVIKNPAVPPSSPFLKAAQRVETDISLFLSLCTNPILAVTGSKGKSTVVSALHHILKKSYPGCRLGGNITRSPLSFLEELNPGDPVILELSSWQLGDLKGRDLLHPEIAVLTNIMNDHQNMYDSFEDYVDDKKVIYRGQNGEQKSIFHLDERGKVFASEAPGTSWFYSSSNSEASIFLKDGKGRFSYEGRDLDLLPEQLTTPGLYFRQNCLIAAAAAVLYGEEPEAVKSSLTDFPGVPHRLELAGEYRGIRFYNDTTATIPEAMCAAVDSFTDPVRLICGGTDKELDYTGAAGSLKNAAGIYILEGSAFGKITAELNESEVGFDGPFSSLKEAFDRALQGAAEGDVILMSPGATSFGMFINEFHRGDSFRELVNALRGNQESSPD